MDTTLQTKQADVDQIQWRGSFELMGSALLHAAGACLADFSLPTFDHLDEEARAYAARAAIQSTEIDAFSVLSEIVSRQSDGAVVLTEADPNEFSFRVLSRALYLKLAKGEESHLIMVTQSGRFDLNEGIRKR
jgi:hypothetical protein